MVVRQFRKLNRSAEATANVMDQGNGKKKKKLSKAFTAHPPESEVDATPGHSPQYLGLGSFQHCSCSVVISRVHVCHPHYTMFPENKELVLCLSYLQTRAQCLAHSLHTAQYMLNE